MAWTTPATYTVGQVLTAATMNAQVRDNELYLKGDVSWTAVSFQNGWTDAGVGSPATAYKRVGDFVVLRGAIKSGGSGTVAFTLPAGYQPASTIFLKALGSADAAGTFIVVATSGTVSVTTTTTTFVALNGIWIPVT